MKTSNVLLSLALLLLTASVGHAQAASAQGELVVVVTGLRGTEGHVNVAVFDRGEPFPERSEAAVRRASVALQGRSLPSGGLEVPFAGLAAGEYAVIVLHDENGNQRMDRNVLGMPREGYGVSNDARSRFGPPKFEAARFRIGQGAHRIEVPVRY